MPDLPSARLAGYRPATSPTGAADLTIETPAGGYVVRIDCAQLRCIADWAEQHPPCRHGIPGAAEEAAVAVEHDDETPEPGSFPVMDEPWPPGGTILLCDTCYQAATGEPAGCQDRCALPLDHDGECGPFPVRDAQVVCQHCGQVDRLTRMDANDAGYVRGRLAGGLGHDIEGNPSP